MIPPSNHPISSTRLFLFHYNINDCHRHLTYVEDRLQAFESALGRLFPGGDLDATVRSLLHDQEPLPRAGSSSKSSSRHSTPAKAEADRHEPAPEALPQQADGFDWAENRITLGDLTDGMAALSIKPEGAGYFGICSIAHPCSHQVLTFPS